MILSIIILLFSGLISTVAPIDNPKGAYVDEVYTLYNAIQFNEGEKPDSVMFRMGIHGFQDLRAANLLGDKEIIALVDFSKPSSERRMWIIDLNSKKVLYHILVAHGKNSGELYATRFSNVPNSYQSSLGMFVTGNIYIGKNGTSLKLYGMQKELNGLAEQRSIVMHGADYVSESFVRKAGRLGRSYGCPAIPMDVHKDVIDLLAGGTLLLLYFPGSDAHASHDYIQK